ncbi:MAG: hypothetical protein KC656_18470, partial [Myxococcales bacterium]|nr:hypothetical protein [Myxococcales bacterium]
AALRAEDRERVEVVELAARNAGLPDCPLAEWLEAARRRGDPAEPVFPEGADPAELARHDRTFLMGLRSGGTTYYGPP